MRIALRKKVSAAARLRCGVSRELYSLSVPINRSIPISPVPFHADVSLIKSPTFFDRALPSPHLFLDFLGILDDLAIQC